jgi:hypothetical protein
VEIPAPDVVRCATHGAKAELIQMPNGQVRYVARQVPGRDAGARDDLIQHADGAGREPFVAF